jgi:outer membrane protein OmpA-like peptidoglycan-associated protein
VNSISSISPVTGSTRGGTVVALSGNFNENLCKVVNVSIDGTNLSSSAWSVTSTLLTIKMPAHDAGLVSIAVYNGCVPVLTTVNFTYVTTFIEELPAIVVTTPIAPTPLSEELKPIIAIPVTPEVKGLPAGGLSRKIYFDLGSYQIKGKNINALKDFVSKIAELGNLINLKVTGYAQPTPGSESTDGVLSENRAAAVAKMLRTFGVNSKVTYKGAGRAKINTAASRYVEVIATSN